MSYLDQLKKQAQEIQEAEQKQRLADEKAKQAQRQAYQDLLRPIYGYFKELAEQLNVVKPQADIKYWIDGYGELDGLQQQNYKTWIDVDGEQFIQRVEFSFECINEDHVVRPIRIKGLKVFKKFCHYLWQSHIEYEETFSQVQSAGTIFIKPKIETVIEISPDLENDTVDLTLQNMNSIGKITYSYPRDCVDNVFLNELTGMILRKPNKIKEMAGAELSFEAREAIKRQILDNMQQQQYELEMNQADPEEQTLTEARKPLSAKQRLSKLLHKKIF